MFSFIISQLLVDMIEYRTFLLLQIQPLNATNQLLYKFFNFSYQNSMTDTTILLVEDDETQRMMASRFLGHKLGYSIEEAADGEKAIARIMDSTKPSIDLVLLDLFMPNMNGKDTLAQIRSSFPMLPVIILTASNEIDDAVVLMKLGASDFITKPFNSERLRLSIEQHLTIRSLSNEVARFKRKEDGYGQFSDLIGAKNGLSACIDLGQKAAKSDIPVLITGESGVGKELMARAIHGEGHRAGRPFIAVNCGAIPENLIESILFGHEKGSFTGAIAREIGKFREAEGGTLFLDEVGELKPDMQTKLLRVLQEKEIEPVGAGKPVKINVRIISATNRDLSQHVTQKHFREDLYYRLHVFPILIPPLRERRSDIPELAQHILARFCTMEQKPYIQISESGMKWLCEQSWPGNVRELENLLYRAVVITDKHELNEIDFITMHNPQILNLSNHYITLLDKEGRAKPWEKLEQEIIEATLQRCNDNVPEAAKLLNMGQSTIYKKLSTKE
jgi:DNA-binding NtrC family response regulator